MAERAVLADGFACDRCRWRYGPNAWFHDCPRPPKPTDPLPQRPSRPARPRHPPAAQRDDRPDRLHDSERPGALKKSVGRSEGARSGKPEDEPRASLLDRVEHHARGYGRETEPAEAI